MKFKILYWTKNKIEKLTQSYKNFDDITGPDMVNFTYPPDQVFMAPQQEITWFLLGFFDSFKGNLTEDGTQNVQTIMANNRSVTLTGLRPGTSYNLTLIAKKNDVYGMPGVLMFRTTAQGKYFLFC